MRLLIWNVNKSKGVKGSHLNNLNFKKKEILVEEN